MFQVKQLFPVFLNLPVIREPSESLLQYSCLENPMDGGAWWAAVHGVTELDTTERLHFHFSLSCIGKGNGNPLQCSCLENPRDGGTWWAAIYGVAQSRTRLKWLTVQYSNAVRSRIHQFYPKLWRHINQVVGANPMNLCLNQHPVFPSNILVFFLCKKKKMGLIIGILAP